jgi:catalase
MTKGGIKNYQRDGFMTVNGNQGSAPNYYPNTANGPIPQPEARMHGYETSGVVNRYEYTHPNDDFIQPGNLYRLMTQDQKSRLISNIVGHLKNARKDIQERQVGHFYKADPDYGLRVAKGLGLDTSKVFGSGTPGSPKL